MNKENKIEEILSSADNCQRAGVPDFFYTRLKAKMERLATPAPTSRSWVLKPAFAMAAVVAVLILNAFIILQNNKTTTSTSDTDTFQSIAAEYRLNDNNNLFDLTEDRQP